MKHKTVHVHVSLSVCIHEYNASTPCLQHRRVLSKYTQYEMLFVITPLLRRYLITHFLMLSPIAAVAECHPAMHACIRLLARV